MIGSTTAQRCCLALVVCAALSVGCVGRAAAQCFADCDGSGGVTRADLGLAITDVFGGVSHCTALDRNADGVLTAADLVEAVTEITGGCRPTPTASPTITPQPTAHATPTRTNTPTATATQRPGVCGDGMVDAGREECDGAHDEACPGKCRSDCSCPPALAGADPGVGAPGAAVTLHGHALTGATSVRFNGVSATFTVISPSEIRTTVPQGAATGPITVALPDGMLSTSSPFIVLTPSTFSVHMDPPTAAVIQGQATTLTVRLASDDGFNQLAALTLSGIPSGVTAILTPPQITSGQSALVKLAVPANQAPMSATIGVTAAATVLGVPSSQATTATLEIMPVTTSFVGRTVVDDNLQTSLAGVAIKFLGADGAGHSTGCSGQTVSDAAGNFMFTNLPDACVGPQLIRYDGSTATAPPGQFAGVDLVYTIVAHQVVSAPVLIHLPRIDNKETVMVQQNAPFDQTFTFATIPFLTVTVYAGTTLSLKDGSQPHPFPLTAIQVPVDRLPDVPDANIPQQNFGKVLTAFIVAFQPANALASQPVAVTFPNTLNTPPNMRMPLITLDPTKGRMVVYGTGTVSNDGTRIIPDPDPQHPGHLYGLVHFDWHGPTAPPPNDTNPGGGGCGPKTSSPVDLATGLEVITTTDLAINGLRGPIGITRTYRTLSNNPGPFGVGTNHNYGYQLNIINQNQGLISLIVPDGNQYPFNEQNDGTFSNFTIPSLRGAVLSANPAGTYDLRWKDGTVFGFQNLGRTTTLTSITDSNGNAITFSRNPAQQIAEVIDPAGRALTLTYDGANRITQIADPIDRTVTYTYNTQGTLETVTDPEGGVTHYDYDDQNRLTKITDARGIVVTTNSYDANGRVIRQVAADDGVTTFGYVLLNSQAGAASPVVTTLMTDPLGNQTTYRFNPQGFIVDVTDALGQTRIFTRDPGTNLLLSVKGPATCAVCGTPMAGDATFTYDTNGDVLTQTDALGHVTSFTYEPTHKVSSVTDPLGHMTTMIYDDHGNLMQLSDTDGVMSRFGYSPDGLITSITTAANETTALTYDFAGNLTATTSPLGDTRYFGYDAVSRLTTATDTGGKTTHRTYDRADRVVAIADPAGATTTFTYNKVGRLLTTIDALNHATTYAYDSMGRVSRRTDALGTDEIFTYDANANLITHLDRKDQTASFSYDRLSRWTRADYADGSGSTFSYDSFGRMIAAVDSNGTMVSRDYDAAGELVREITDRGIIQYMHDEAGRRTSMTASGHSPVVYAYDERSHLIAISQDSANAHFSYDLAGRRTRSLLPNGVSTEYTYDASSRIIHLSYQHDALQLGRIEYAYDSNDHEIRRDVAFGTQSGTPPRDAIASASYDDDNRQLTLGDTQRTFDANGNLTLVSNSNGTTRYTWDARNRLVSLSRPGLEMDFGYDAFGRRVRRRVGDQSTAYRYDDLDVIEEISGNTSTPILHGFGIDEPLMRGSSEYYLFDALGSVIALTDPTGLIRDEYTYSAYGRPQHFGPSNNPYQYAGREFDVASSLGFNRARYYDPYAARFVSQDSFQTILNRYEYSLDNPIKYRDPSGNIPLLVIIPLVGGAVNAVTSGAKAYYCGGGFGDIAAAAGRGFVSGAVGTAVGLAVGLATKNPVLIGGAAGLSENLTNQLLSGRGPGQLDAIEAGEATFFGGLGGAIGRGLLPVGPGRPTSLLRPRGLGDFGPNSLQPIGETAVGGAVSGGLGGASSSCGCRP